ncbi:MAG: phosphate acetyltransferase [Tissierellia bacterium]|nr:phosphate acetyltransferase [Tissierellia bacterium]
MRVMNLLKEKILGKNIKILFPEGHDIRIIEAAVQLKEENLLEPILMGERDEIEKAAKKGSFDISNIRIESHKQCQNIDDLAKAFFERRKGKVTLEEARDLVCKDSNLHGAMLVYTGIADGMVSGALHSTADTVRPALQVIKTNPNYSIVSGLMVMQKDDTAYFFADCGININPTAEQLAEIAAESYMTVKSYDCEPRIAMLSFSTNGSAKSEESEKVKKATQIVKEKYPYILVDGEMQFDAAIRPEVGELKFPGSPVAGKANTFIFPTLDAGNIGYKIAQRLGGFNAVGPILQGLNAPVNDLSRGCVPFDIYNLAIITASQALENGK